MNPEPDQALYLFLDESGNLDFSPNGTRYFVLTCASMARPFLPNQQMEPYRYDCLEWGLSQERFHCAEDNQHVRRRVFEIIGESLDGLRIDSLIVEKRKTGPALQAERRFYPEMLGHLLKFVASGVEYQRAKELIIITDTLPMQRRRRAVEGAIRTTLAKMMPTGPRYRILHHDSRSHYGLQVADYCCWAIYRRYERGDDGPYHQIRRAVASEFDIFRTGSRYYY